MKNWQHTLLGILIGLILSGVLYIIAVPPRGTSIELIPAPTPAPILVHVDGEIQHPGVYPLPRESRVQDAIQAAGGLKENANHNAVNLAERLKDGQKLNIPAFGTPNAPVELPAAPQKQKEIAAAGSKPSGPIDLNTATAEDLQTLPGIGPSRAQQIIDYRETHGGFKTIADLQDISGIGEATFLKLKDLIIVN